MPTTGSPASSTTTPDTAECLHKIDPKAARLLAIEEHQDLRVAGRTPAAIRAIQITGFDAVSLKLPFGSLRRRICRPNPSGPLEFQ